jgi:phosphoenolpyruvate carboxykinase (diphosphate)
MDTIASKIGLVPQPAAVGQRLRTYINLKLAAIGCPVADAATDENGFGNLAESMLAHNRETARLLADYQCPADWRIQKFLDEYLYPTGLIPRLPSQTFILDRHGLARALSIPCDGDEFVSDIISSYRVKQGVLHNPAKDRRTTQGVFHVAEGGLPIPDDKKAVPLPAFARMLDFALKPPRELMRVPFTAGRAEQAECFVSLLLRPLVCPAVPGFTPEKRMEVRFFAPGNLVSNLDFVESIFGNGGDPFLPQNDAGLDPEHWSGHSGCVILAPHLVTITKVQAGLPHWDHATDRQRRDGMCWKSEDELYNGGSAFKITARNESGVIVTLIADNYFGYCKKEVKTQIGFAANLLGRVQEEHAGGALVFAAYDLGEEFDGSLHVQHRGHSLEEACRIFPDVMEMRPEGYAVDKTHSEIVYVPTETRASLQTLRLEWTDSQGRVQTLKLLPGRVYMRPSGYRVELRRNEGDRRWRLVGTRAEALYCHKPCTVSGGGKSEISKPIADAIIQGPVYVSDFKTDFDAVAELLGRDYSQRFRDPARNGKDRRAILSPERSLGSVIKLLAPSPADYTDEYNAWLGTIPPHVKELLFVVKRFHNPAEGEDWRSAFSVDTVNGMPGHELKFHNKLLTTDYLRVGFETDGSWRVFSLRQDFFPAAKLQMEDDITASVVVPLSALQHPPADQPGGSVKFAENCEYRLFQRPDDAIHPGYDKQTEADFSKPGNFFSNYQPLRKDEVRELFEDAVNFSKFTRPMQEAIRAVIEGEDFPRFFVCSASPRLVDGVPTKNPRYLQTRQDLVRPLDAYLADISQRLLRRIPTAEPLHAPVTAVLPGRRNNPAEKSIRSLAVFNPIHWLELPELFLEYICSLTGKSPSTTGAGSEGALTKGPFNALPPIFDLNAALVDHLLTRQAVFLTSAGHVGPKVRVDHDVSLLVPEVWSRMTPEERSPEFLIENGCLERVPDIEFEGRVLPSSRLGWRITAAFVRRFFGRIFNYPHRVFTGEILHPETQDLAAFADGMDNITETQKLVAQAYFADGGVDMACPPLRALLHIMRDGHYEGKTLDDPAVRELFDPEKALASDWYRARLETAAAVDRELWRRHVKNLQTFIRRPHNTETAERLGLPERLGQARAMLEKTMSPDYAESLRGTLGTQPLPD